MVLIMKCSGKKELVGSNLKRMSRRMNNGENHILHHFHFIVYWN